MALIKLADLQIATSDIVDDLTLAGIQGGSSKGHDRDYGCNSYCGGKGKGEHEEEKEKEKKYKYDCD